MKRFILTILAALTIATAGAQKKVFSKYKNNNEVEIVNIGRGKLALARAAADKNVKKIARKLKGSRVLACEDRKLTPQIGEEFLKAYQSEGCTELMQTHDGDEAAYVYEKPRKGRRSRFSVLKMWKSDEVDVFCLSEWSSLKFFADAKDGSIDIARLHRTIPININKK